MEKLHCLPVGLTCALLVVALFGCKPAPRDADGAPAVGSAAAQSLTQTFSWQGLTLRHPSNYVVSDKEYDGETYTFCCEIEGDDISLCNVSIRKDKVFRAVPGLLSDGDVLEVLEEGVEHCSDYLRSMDDYSDLHFGKTESETSGRYPTVMREFDGKLLGISLSGKMIAFIGSGKLVVVMLQAGNGSYMQTLLAIADSIRLE